MYKFNLSKLIEKQKGIIYIVVGFILLLYTLNFFQRWLNILLFLFALGLIAYGAYRLEFFTVVFPKQKAKK
jgi:glucan phosphoethanolaminetransferase (alkaline phosphatase superfamily)